MRLRSSETRSKSSPPERLQTRAARRTPFARSHGRRSCNRHLQLVDHDNLLLSLVGGMQIYEARVAKSVHSRNLAAHGGTLALRVRRHKFGGIHARRRLLDYAMDDAIGAAKQGEQRRLRIVASPPAYTPISSHTSKSSFTAAFLMLTGCGAACCQGSKTANVFCCACECGVPSVACDVSGRKRR